MKLRINRFLPQTRAEGPGVRACLWVQGCPIQCKGCAVPWTWSNNEGTEIDVQQLTDTILNGPPVEGITFLGGEPFEQAEALIELARILKAQGLSIMTFSGYSLEHIKQSNRTAWHELLKLTDLLIDGPFVQELVDYSRPWVGSKNQRYHFLSSRYKALESSLKSIPNRVEIRITPEGIVTANGMIDASLLPKLIH